MKYKIEIFIYIIIFLSNLLVHINANQTKKVEKSTKLIKEKEINIQRKLPFSGGYIDLNFNTGFQTDTCWYSRLADKIGQVSVNYETLTTFPSSFEIQEGQSVQVYFNTNLQDLSYFLSYDESDEEANIPTECRITDHFKSHIISIDLSNLEISQITTMSYMFKGYTSLRDIYFRQDEMQNLLAIKGMFSGCSSLTSIDLRYLTTSQVTDMSYIFSGCSSLEYLEVDYFDTPLVINMEYMFSGCSSLTSFTFSTFSSVSSVQTMEGMFSSCTALTKVMAYFTETDSLTNMNSMFSNCIALTEISLDDFSTDNVQSMNSLFYKCSSLVSLNLQNWNTINVNSMNNIFSECTSLITLEIPNFYMQQLMGSTNVFNNANNIRYLNIKNMKYSSTEDYDDNTCVNHDCNLPLNYDETIFVCQSNKFITNSNIKEICCSYDIENNACLSFYYFSIYFNQNINYPTGFKNNYRNGIAFINYNGNTISSSEELNIIANTELLINYEEPPTTMEKYFSQEEDNNMMYLLSIDFSNFGIYVLKNMDSMFYGCISLVSLDFSSVYAYEVTNMANLFYGCSSLKSVTFSEDFGMSAENMDSMFAQCTALEILNLSFFNTQLVQTMDNMFYNCASLKLLDISSFTISSTTSTTQMFTGLQNLNFINLYNTEDTGGKITSSELNTLEKDFFVCQQNNIITNPKATECCDYAENEVHCEINITKLIEIEYNNIKENIENQAFKIIKIDNNFLQFSSLFDHLKNNNNSISKIDLGKCEDKIRQQEGLNDNEQFLIIKLDLRNKFNNATYVQYEILNPRNYSKVSLDICKNMSIIITVPILMSEKDYSLIKSVKDAGYNIFDLKDDFYNDVCSTYTAQNGADLALSSRKTYIYDSVKDIYLCQSGCEFKEFNTDTNNSVCSCKVQQKETILDLAKISFDKSEFLENFYDTLYNSNFRVFKCIKLLFSLKGMNSNYGSYTMSGLVGAFIAFAIIHLIKGPNKVLNIINNILETKLNSDNIKENNSKIDKENSREENNDKIILNDNLEIKIEELNAPFKKKISLTKSIKFTKEAQSTKEDLYNPKTEEEKNKISNEKRKETDIKEKEDNESENDEDENKIKEKYKNLLDEEINRLDYKIAIVIDKRTFWQYYFSLLKRGHLIIFTFITIDDYNLREIKILLFIVSFSLYFFINAFFFTDETMDNIYEDNGIFNFLFQLPQIIYSSLVTSVLNIILKSLAISEEKIFDMKKEKDSEKFKQKAKSLKRNLKIKLIIFLILSSLLMLLFWYFISCFCAAFTNTQLILIEDTLISFILSMIYPFGLKLLPGFMRIPALRANNKDNKCLYKISLLLSSL